MRTFFAIAALLFFCAPVGLRLVGVKAEPFENRRLAEAPELSAGWDVFDQATRFFVDRLPLREQAVRANSWVALHVFDTTPDTGGRTAGGSTARDALPFGEPDAAAKPGAEEGERVKLDRLGVTVLRGRDGWLYLQEELSWSCVPPRQTARELRRYERLVSLIRASGRDVVFTLAPNKSTVYPEYLPETAPDQACAAPGRTALWDAVEGSTRPEILGLRQAMLAGKAPPPEHSYTINDSHWGSKGAVLGVAAVLEALGTEAQVADGDIVRERGQVAGDLSQLLGAPEEHDTPLWRIERGPAAPVIPGRTLLVYDSYGVVMEPPLRAYARELATQAWFFAERDDLVEAIAAADTVVLEAVERHFHHLVSDDGPITPAFLDALDARLRRTR
jgi:hypothetical protein